MNEKFLELPEEKQQAIINASFEVFAKNDYKHASTDDIAAKAGISKGLLFYYFHNKQELYTYMYKYATELMIKEVIQEQYFQIDDFFELLKYAANIKYGVSKKNPYLFRFSEKVLTASDPQAGTDIRELYKSYTEQAFNNYFTKINMNKFRDDIDFAQILQMFTWMAEGYMFDLQQKNQKADLDVMMGELDRWIAVFKKMAYKEEYQNESNRD